MSAPTNTNPARGMRDFLPSDVRKREYVIGIIKEVYESYGFEPLETPAVENIETLTGKYGEEGNQLIYKILKRGEKLEPSASEKELSDLALRYDLTVPLARVVANHKNDLPRFFKRYQIQPVWRADRPARGRYREFYQCDVDAIGSSSMIVEAELCSAVSEILQRLGFDDFVIRINHREILRGMLDASWISQEKHNDTLVVLDKIDKIGREAAISELIQRDVPIEGINKLFAFIRSILERKIEGFDERIRVIDKTIESLENSLEYKVKENYKDVVDDVINQDLSTKKELNKIIWERLAGFISEHIEGRKGLKEISLIISYLEDSNVSGKFLIDPTLARGLSYYTGAIMEIELVSGDFKGSLGGGGRYDGLIGMFGKEQIPACGFSLGLERILVVMEEREMFPKELETNSADVLVTVWNEESIGESLKLAGELRQQNLRVLVYPEADKLGKQFKYASAINVSFVCVLGETELTENKVTLKNMRTGEQETVLRGDVASKLKGLPFQNK